MKIFASLIMALLAASPVLAQINAAPVQFYGQYVPTGPATALPATNGATTARSNFLADLDPSSISFFDFEGETVTYTATSGRPTRSSTASLEDMTTARFDGYGTRAEIPARVFARNAEIVNPSNRTAPNIDGTWATSGNKYLYAVGYDGSSSNVSLPAGQTQVALSLRYDSTAATPGTTARPFSAFGGYIIDTEAYEQIRVTLTPLGGGTQVVLDYGPVSNENNQTDDPRGDFPGNYQVAFVGFTDFDSQYEQIDISFIGRDQSTVNNEAFGFDDFVVGEVNQVNGPLAPTTTGPVVDEPGWRLLSAPVRGVTVDDLAQQNLVQGVPAGDGVSQAQYPDAAGSNFYWAYQGGTRWDYVPVPSTGSLLRPGRGFWWYWYDVAIPANPTANGGGSSASVELDEFQLQASGPELLGTFSEEFVDNTNCASDLTTCPTGFTTPNGDPTLAGAPDGTVTPNDDDFYMIGNPYPRPYLVSSISATGGTLQDAMFAWNPGRQSGTNPRTGEDTELDGPGSYEILFQTPLPGEQAAAAVWQGMLAEVSKTQAEVGEAVTFTYDRAGSLSAGAPPFHGLTARSNASAGSERFLHLKLDGTTASERAVRDDVTYVRFRHDATDAWDRFDASKPSSPASGTGLALLGERDGERRTQAVLSLSSTDRPAKQRWAVVHLAFAADEAGTYTISWDGDHGKAKLMDREAGRSARLHRDSSYTFQAEAGDWDERFVLVFFPPEETTSAAAKASTEAPETLIGQPMPNPTVGDFWLDVQITTEAEATVSVYDALGRRVYGANVGAAEAARGTLVKVPTEGLAPGAYVVTVEAPGVRETRRVTVVR